MKIYNSLTKKVEDFKPIEEGKVSLYSCGPTVYNNLHIGNLSAFIYADILKRTLRGAGYKVKHVMNLTDVDDKTIRNSKRDYPKLEPIEALNKLTAKYSEVFLNDIKSIGDDVDSIEFIKATDTIDEMIALTQTLLDNGVGYIADDGVYFSIKAYKDSGYKYGLLQKVEISESRARISNDEYDKDSANDFVLWKATTDGEPSWPATFKTKDREISMPGRPGWHIECSAMSQKLLGVPFDIHTGGIDLKFPHHENEIAQSCGAGAKKLANYFVHNNHILIDGKKMSKSLGNVYTLRDLDEKGFSPEAFRLLVLESHYTKESNFSWEILEAANNRLKNYEAMADLVFQPTKGKLDEKTLTLITEDTPKELLLASQNDLDTPRMLKALSILETSLTDGVGDASGPLLELLKQVDELLGTKLSMRDDITNEQKTILQAREASREKKDWAESDRLRDQMLEQGINIRDSKNGQIWNRI